MRENELALKAQTYEVADWSEWLELAYERNWTDGLPVAPPTRAKVEEMIRYVGRDPQELIGHIPPKLGQATMEKIAINCVMAGCKPEYMPVVIAAIEAMLEPEHNLQGVQTTTHSCEPLTIVSGPVVKELGFKTAECVFGGGGGRPNVTIGRAIRLVLWNIGGGYPGEPCKETLGHPGRFAFLIPEDSDHSPWEPIHVERGFGPQSSAVTVFACEAPQGVGIFWGTDLSPRLSLGVMADTMSALGNNNTHIMGEVLAVFSPNAAKHVAASGWTKKDVKSFLFEHARRPIRELRPRSPRRPDTNGKYWYPWWPKWVDQSREDTLVPVVEKPEDIHIVVTGGIGIPWAAVCPGWGNIGGFAVTKPMAK